MDKDQMLIDSFGKTIQVQADLINYLKAEIERLKVTVPTYNPGLKPVDPNFYIQPLYPQNPQPFIPTPANPFAPPFIITCDTKNQQGDSVNSITLNGDVVTASGYVGHVSTCDIKSTDPKTVHPSDAGLG